MWELVLIISMQTRMETFGLGVIQFRGRSWTFSTFLVKHHHLRYVYNNVFWVEIRAREGLFTNRNECFVTLDIIIILSSIETTQVGRPWRSGQRFDLDLPLTADGSNAAKDFAVFHVSKLSSTEGHLRAQLKSRHITIIALVRRKKQKHNLLLSDFSYSILLNFVTENADIHFNSSNIKKTNVYFRRKF